MKKGSTEVKIVVAIEGETEGRSGKEEEEENRRKEKKSSKKGLKDLKKV